ncbi:glutathione synthetase [Halteromyces radiatus]|uniref:glutathione synthetase n=1 Tax=Halteromyces radiatus TaxID=101107 RepID=UPI00221F3399|nr:glutathione synthetase [Halteromyces radiatus]KAI8096912.1 glutathione synthetase [Halteromyces radiatus]
MSIYPPLSSSTQLNHIRAEAIDWALAHGLIVRPTTEKQQYFEHNAAVTHAPLALYPTPFPRAEFFKAKDLQIPWNTLIHRMSKDNLLLKELMETLSQVDDFMKRLYDIYLQVKTEGIAQSASLGIHRCDYLLHADLGADAHTARIQQVEFNTIASSFGSLSTRTTELHKYLLSSIDNYGEGQITADQLPDNNTVDSIAQGLASAWKLYGKSNARVMMIVQPGERNAFDQRWIEYALMEKYGIHLLRRSLEQVINNGKLDPVTKALTIDGYEIAVTYFRAGYGPEDYPTEKEWEARLTIERSLSIKCPTVAYQLVGAKKVQQVLSVPGRLERYVDDDATADQLRESFAGLYPLDDSLEGNQAYEMALQDPQRYVLKPQREGGGNNVYGDDIVSVLQKTSVQDRNAYILMDLIRTPPLDNLMLREGVILNGQVVSELGIYGVYLNDGTNEVVNNIGGHLLRTKGVETKEGGVAAGFAVIDSPLLV